MEENKITKVEFALGSEVTSEQFFKSSFARSFVTNSRDVKSMDTDFDRENDEDQSLGHDYFSLADFANNSVNMSGIFPTETKLAMEKKEEQELDQLRKQCQALTEENQRLQSVLQTNQIPRVQAIDNVFLQTQIDTLKWQMKQTEANQQMYRSLMRQVVRFLDRARKSLDIIHDQTSPTRKNKTAIRNNRTMSVYVDDSEVPSPITTSKFTRAKSVAQISSPSGYSGFRDFTWSVLRRNDQTNCTTPRIKQEKVPRKQNSNKALDGTVYLCPNKDAPSEEENEDHVPAEKLSQEAFRLMRTVESLLAMQEPDLTAISSSPFETNSSSASSTSSACSTNSSIAVEKDTNNNKKDSQLVPYFETEAEEKKETNCPNIHNGSPVGDDEFSFKRIDEAFLDTEERKNMEDNNFANRPSNISRKCSSRVLNYSPNVRVNKCAALKEDRLSILRDEKLSIVNSADDESGFSSMNSFQDVGIPVATVLPTNGGFHTEIGVPEVPMDKSHHRRWSSNPIELQSIMKKYKNGFMNNRAKVEKFSVWV